MPSNIGIAVITPLIHKAKLLWGSIFDGRAEAAPVERTEAVGFPLGGGVYLLYCAVSGASELGFQDTG